MASRFNSEIQILNLLQTIDKYLLYQRKLKMSKSEQYKDNLKNQNKSRQSQSMSRVSPEEGKRSDGEGSDTEKKKTQLADITEQLSEKSGGDDDAKSVAGSFKSGKSKKSRGKSRGQLSEIAEDADFDDTEGGTSRKFIEKTS